MNTTQPEPPKHPISSFALFKVFFRIGLFSVGGGYAMLPMLKRELVENHKWISSKDLLNFYAIGQSTPGIIAVNTATFTGYKKAGVTGALASTAGIVVPSVAIISLLAAFFAGFQNVPLVQNAFKGIRVGVCVNLGFTLFSLFRQSIKDTTGIVLALLALYAVALLRVSPVLVIIAAGLYGWISGIPGHKRQT